ncbi:uncharacterized protein LOC117290419 isoform X3 [Asterias rubens]|uniref:uncharacterized protein LOC117290419 isoform X3 n=1 Tax=Asterias rubens TaxID=7604 RepID=UPI001455580E|nr:uncharacterized protein LOC117290419 isoform X3 [Asterias rubens]
MWQTTPQRMCLVLLAILTVGQWTNWYSASAQKIIPVELQTEYVRSQIRMHFCADGGDRCLPSGDLQSICCGINTHQCFEDIEHPMCMEADQVYVCGYRDAIVCRYQDSRGSCIYSNSSSIQPLCSCNENGSWPTSGAQASQIRGSCMDIETTVGSPGSSPGPPTVTSSMSDQTTVISPTSDQTTVTIAPRKPGSVEVNITSIVLGAILVIVLLVLLALVVMLVKCRRNQTPPMKVTKNPTNSAANSAAPDSRIPVPTLVPRGGDYAYADVTPTDHETAVHEDAVNHTYGNVKSNKQKRGLSRFVEHKQLSPGMPNQPPGGSDRIAPELPTKDTTQVLYEIPDIKATTKATGVATIGANNEVCGEGGLPGGEEIIEHTYFERK